MLLDAFSGFEGSKHEVDQNITHIRVLHGVLPQLERPGAWDSAFTGGLTRAKRTEIPKVAAPSFEKKKGSHELRVARHARWVG